MNLDKSLIKSIDDSFITIINYPEILDKSNIISSILTIQELIGTPVFLMVEEPLRINDNLGITLPSEIFLPYEYDEKLQSLLDIKCYIFIDDIIKFKEIFKKIHRVSECHLIFVPSYINDKVIEMFNSKFKPNMLYMKCLKNNHQIKYQLETYDDSMVSNNIITLITLQGAFNNVKSLIYIPDKVHCKELGHCLNNFKTTDFIKGLNKLEISFLELTYDNDKFIVINSNKID